ncbi:MAG TPA: class I SAM-dependent methyltransferase [Bacillaceae bacterium]
MNQKEYDRLLRIDTAGMKDWPLQLAHYNRYEATPYEGLDELFGTYELDRSDRLVDFGCGKGRLLFYVHHRFGVSGTGVEVNGQLYQEALENLSSYLGKGRKRSDSIRFERIPAEKYPIGPEETLFYFFNPFSIQIFMKVIHNILLSAEQHPRRTDVILYYPHPDYIRFLGDRTPFQLIKEVPVSGLFQTNENERFLVYRLE